ncbi:protein of unknown function DUF833 [Alkaliphilus metalliredigens QYMF]|uniref:NRDE family protein n=1 Tax=Alkaliphilus metalliredigens (strain QYMF) TaxID=293826 RepID=A6TUG5_ALKMQ|nr:NRDE family protein [Alkaliphilus metalliredigens]ABR49833.1 protein of unknown function DUF833 [Alkaliphilus metalliredigens QYMF]
MCILFFAYKVHPKYDFIFLGNRDEFTNRPTLNSHFWDTYPNILAGIDLEKGGTWAGVTKEGRVAFLTNYRDPSLPSTAPLSRGFLTRDFLIQGGSPLSYLENIQTNQSKYNGFNLIVGTLNDLWFYSNIENEIRPIKPGLYGLSNALLNTPWFKVDRGKKRLAALLDTDFTVEQLFDILDDTEVPPDGKLPKTGVPLEMERLLSTIHIDSPAYGTRSKTVILMTNKGELQFYEKALEPKGNWALATYQFNVHMEHP